MTTAVKVLFVCVRNSGKSQMAAGLLRAAAGDRIEVHSAGTDPGVRLNALSVASLREVGVDIGGEVPKPVDPPLLAVVDLVVVLGREAELDAPAGVRVLRWDTDEPSARGIEGIERMRLVRDDITARIRALAAEFDSTIQL
ncbi:low molecular weight phosphatase family protein [Nocardia sp. NPDC051750]|uniref:low molecular weight phosphatase family protein n=1 Tax=Nocardia sp. NPDC051750 TaxID=3364325 RepID=UPI0037873A57